MHTAGAGSKEPRSAAPLPKPTSWQVERSRKRLTDVSLARRCAIPDRGRLERSSRANSSRLRRSDPHPAVPTINGPEFRAIHASHAERLDDGSLLHQLYERDVVQPGQERSLPAHRTSREKASVTAHALRGKWRLSFHRRQALLGESEKETVCANRVVNVSAGTTCSASQRTRIDLAAPRPATRLHDWLDVTVIAELGATHPYKL